MAWVRSHKKSGGSSPVLITKSITVNGTYNASSDNADGYSSVIVNVQHPTPTPETDPNFGELVHYVDFMEEPSVARVYSDKFSPYCGMLTPSACTVTTGVGVTGFVSSATCMTLPIFGDLQVNDTIVLDFGTCNWGQGTNHGRLLMYTYDCGLIYRNGSNWNFYGGGWGSTGITTTQNYFSNAKMGIKFTSNTTLELYKDSVLEGTLTNSQIYRLFSNTSALTIGSSSGNGFGVVDLKSIKIYRPSVS